jgi:ATP-dependent Clp protease ATP-binding subunit ClpA
MLSASLELVLAVSQREAQVRRHTHLTLEHLLFAIAHDPEGERILLGAGAHLVRLRADLRGFLEEFPERSARGPVQEPTQTLAFRRVLQRAVLHMQSAGKDEADVGDVLAALLQQTNSHAVGLLTSQGVTRLDVLNFIAHGISKVPQPPGGDDPALEGSGEEGASTARDPLGAYVVDLTQRARDGKLDPLIGRTAELQRTMEVLCRRRKNNPVFVGDPGVGKTALIEGLALKLIGPDAPPALSDVEIFALDTSALLAGTRYRGDFEERFKAVIAALLKRPKPVLFIDEMHIMVGAEPRPAALWIWPTC